MARKKKKTTDEVPNNALRLYSRWEGSEEIPVYSLADELSRLKYDPLHVLVDLARHAEMEEVRYKAAARIYDSVFPKKKSIDIGSDAPTRKLIFDVQLDAMLPVVSEVTAPTLKKNSTPFFKKMNHDKK